MKFEVEKDNKEQGLHLLDIVKLPQDIKTENTVLYAGYYMVVYVNQVYYDVYHDAWYTLLNLKTGCVDATIVFPEISQLYKGLKDNTCNGKIKIYSGDKSKMILKEITNNK